MQGRGVLCGNCSAEVCSHGSQVSYRTSEQYSLYTTQALFNRRGGLQLEGSGQFGLGQLVAVMVQSMPVVPVWCLSRYYYVGSDLCCLHVVAVISAGSWLSTTMQQGCHLGGRETLRLWCMLREILAVTACLRWLDAR